MYRPATLLTFSLCALSTLTSSFVRARPCVAFTTQWNLLAFGFDGKDYDAGTQDTWGSGSVTDITASGRPPFDGETTTCYLSQFTNAVYVMNGDASNPAAIHIYDATAKSWSTQATTLGGFDITKSTAILDHDTNVFYAIVNGELWSLNMDLLKAANSTPIGWLDNKAVGFPTDGYQPVMALAQNHVHFLNVPGVPAGSAKIFVIHFSYFQPEDQRFGDFPATHGRAFDIFKQEGVQKELAFIPDDGSATYVINVERNDTQALPGPSTKDAQATYFGSPSALVQLSPSTKSVSFFPYNADNHDANKNAGWSPVTGLANKAVVANPASSNATNGGAAAPASGPSTSTGTAKASSSTGGSSSGQSNQSNSPSNANGGERSIVAAGWLAVALIGMMSFL